MSILFKKSLYHVILSFSCPLPIGIFRFFDCVDTVNAAIVERDDYVVTTVTICPQVVNVVVDVNLFDLYNCHSTPHCVVVVFIIEANLSACSDAPEISPPFAVPSEMNP